MKITSKDNKLIKLAKKLHTRKERKEANLFLIEGEKLIKEAISSQVKLHYLFYKEGKVHDFNLNKDTQDFEIPEHFMEFISTTDSAPPYLAIAQTINWPDISFNNASLILIILGLQDPGNFGTIIRSSEATGVDYIIATKGTVDLFNPKVVRSSMGSVFRQPVAYIENLEKMIFALQSEDWQFVMTSPYAEKSFHSFDYTKKTAFVIGNEGQGIGPHLLKTYQSIKIPMFGQVESLNTSIAASLLLYEVVRQRGK